MRVKNRSQPLTHIWLVANGSNAQAEAGEETVEGWQVGLTRSREVFRGKS